MSYVDDLDMCAAAGIINFDAPSFIKGTTPRYVGNPPFETIPDFSPALPMQPQKDEFKKPKKHHDAKAIIGYSLVAAAVLMIIARIAHFDISKIKLPKIGGAEGSSIKDLAKKAWGKITGLFKKAS